MASETSILGRLEAHVSHLRDNATRLGSELAHLREEREILMQYLSDFGTALKTLISDRQASDARANAAESENATLKSQIAADEATLKGMLDATNAEISAEQPAASSSASTAPSTSTVTTPAPAVTVTVVPTAAPAESNALTGVTTDPGTTSHVDATTGTTTTVDHASGEATAVNAAGASVAPDPSVVADAKAATQAAGVTVAAPVV